MQLIIPNRISAGGGDMLRTNNLADVISVPAARANLGVLARDEVTARVAGEKGGLTFDGATAGARLVAALTNQAVGTSPLSVFVRASVPLRGGSSGVGLLSLAASNSTSTVANAFQVLVGSTALSIYLFGGTTSDWRSAQLDGFMAAYAGKVVDVLITRNGNSLSVFLNGTLVSLTEVTNGVAPNWGDTINGSFLWVGAYDNTHIWPGDIYRAAVFNLALGQPQVDELSLAGIPSWAKWGSQAILYASDFSAGVDAWMTTITGVTTTGNVDGVNGQNDWLKSERTGAAGYLIATRVHPAHTLATGKRNRISARIYNPNAAGLWFDAGWDGYYSGSGVWVPAGGQVDAVIEYQWQPGNVAMSNDLRLGLVTSQTSGLLRTDVGTGQAFYIKALSVMAVGCVCELDLSCGKGAFIGDRSTNRCWGELSTIGVAHKLELGAGEFVVAKYFAHGDISSLGGTTRLLDLPPNCAVLDVEFDRESAFDASTTLDVGTAGNTTLYVAAKSVASAGKTVATVSAGNTCALSGSAWTTVYLKKNQATTSGGTTVRARCVIRGF